MPCSSPFAPWVNELVRRGVTAGCGNGLYCPNNVVNRDQMAIFLATNFGLPLPPAP
jgi:S-layer homology domain